MKPKDLALCVLGVGRDALQETPREDWRKIQGVHWSSYPVSDTFGYLPSGMPTWSSAHLKQ